MFEDNESNTKCDGLSMHTQRLNQERGYLFNFQSRKVHLIQEHSPQCSVLSNLRQKLTACNQLCERKKKFKMSK